MPKVLISDELQPPPSRSSSDRGVEVDSSRELGKDKAKLEGDHRRL